MCGLDNKFIPTHIGKRPTTMENIYEWKIFAYKSDLTTMEKLIMQKMLESIGNRGFSWFKIDNFAELINTNKDTVRKKIASLVRKGYLGREKEHKGYTFFEPGPKLWQIYPAIKEDFEVSSVNSTKKEEIFQFQEVDLS